MKQKLRRYSPDEKVAILRRHLLEQVPVSELCREHELHPNVFYRWQKEFFEGGAAAFAKESSGQITAVEGSGLAMKHFRLSQESHRKYLFQKE